MKFGMMITLSLVAFFLTGCGNATQTSDGITPTPATSNDETATLLSLEQVDDYPLYTMRYFGTYPGRDRSDLSKPTVASAQSSCRVAWGCSLFAALGDGEDRLLGHNFDWHFSPALLLFTDPADGYASVSMVDIEYLGFEGERSKNLTDLPLEERRALLDAPSLPFDGMNEKGLAVGMAAVPEEVMPHDPQKKTLDELEVIREILDHAATVDEAISILDSFNIDMGEVPIHYLIASASGESAVVEFYQGEMVVFRNESTWQVATNFLLASTNGNEQGQCWRYDLLEQRLNELQGWVSSNDALHLLEDVSQDITQWSIVYHLASGDLEIVMGQDYSEIHEFHLEQMVP
ncbi:MAG: carcinine hydrolase/isopenicillin-N N-acyltransferase family protein [Chloroflexota bacterium]